MINPCCCGPFCPPLPPVDAWENITLVEPWEYGATAGIAPYSRYWNTCSAGSCFPASFLDACGSEGTAENPELAQPVCATHGFDRVLLPRPEYPPSGVLPCAAGSGETIDQIIENCYRKRADKVTIPRTCLGWKGVQSYVHWPGIPFGFTDCSCDCYIGESCTPPANPQFKYASTSWREKFTETRVAVTRRNTDGAKLSDENHNIEKDWQQTATVDRDGNVTRTGYRRWTDTRTIDYTPAGGIPDSSWSHTDNGTGKPIYGSTVPTKVPFDGDADVPVSIGVNACGATLTWVLPSPGSPITDTLANLNASDLYKITDSDEWFGITHRVITATGIGATFTLTNYEVTCRFNGTMHRVDTEYGYDILDETWTWEYETVISIDPSNLITFAEVVARAEDLLDLWRLQDDAIHPWRTDASTWLQPLVTHDGAASVPTINWPMFDSDGNACPGIDCTGTGLHFYQDNFFTGATIGAPTPPGYEPFFDFTHLHWAVCSDGFGSCGECANYLGALNPISGVCATHWTNNKEGGTMFGPGAHAAQLLNYTLATGSSGQTAIAGVALQKWAETLEAWPRVNYSRCPGGCGADREVIDNRTDCASTTKRWPSARAICGKLNVVTASGTGTVTVTTDEKTWLVNGDIVEFEGVTGLAATYAVTVVSDMSFTVSGTVSGYVGGGFVKSYLAGPPSPDPRNWSSTCPDHTFVWRQFMSDWRSYELDGETYPFIADINQETLTPSATEPSVLYCSPNAADSFARGFRPDWVVIAADLCFGVEWHLDFQQTMTDPFWTQPDIGIDCGVMNSAPCVEDGDYPFHPLVEAALTPPTGAPTLPDGVVLWPDGIPANTMPSNVGFPSSCDATPNDYPTVHDLRADWLACDDWKAPINHNCDTLPPP